MPLVLTRNVASPGEAMGQPLASMPRLQRAFISAPVWLVTNKLVADAPAAGLGAAPGVEARHLGAVRYVPGLHEAYWFGIPPVMRQPQDAFAKDIAALARGLSGD